MAELEWSLLGQQPNFLERFAQGQQLGEQMKTRKARANALAMFASNPDEAASTALAGGDLEGYQALSNATAGQRKLQAQQKVGGMVAAGDLAGARRSAYGAGEFDLGDHLSKMDDEQRAKALDASNTLIAVGNSLKGLPTPEARKAAAQSQAGLLASHNITPEMIDKFDYSDNGIAAAVGSAMSLKEQLERDKPVVVAAGSHLVKDGKSIYDAPEAAKYVNVPQGSDLHIFGGQGSTAAPSGPATDYQGAIKSLLSSGVVETSGYRTAAENQRIGGAPNSHHKDGTPQDPGAHDLRPRKGQSLEQLRDEVLAKGFPDQNVVIEHTGDRYSTGPHVHVTMPSVPGPPGGPMGERVIHGQPKPAAQEPSTTLSPQAIDTYAQLTLANGGKPPPLGQGKAGTAARILVMNRVAEMAQIQGINGTGIANQGITRHADSLALNQMTKTTSIVDAAEQTATKAADFVMQDMAGFGGTRYPLLNKALMAGRRATGDARVDVAVNRLGTFVDEYAKVIAGGTGNAPATDGVRNEARRRINEAGSPEQLTAVLDSMKTEMQFRSGSLHDGMDTLRTRLGDKVAAGAQPAKAASPYTAAQQKALARFKGSRAAPGSAGSPYVPTTEGQYNNLPHGAHYIFTDGSIQVKP